MCNSSKIDWWLLVNGIAPLVLIWKYKHNITTNNLMHVLAIDTTQRIEEKLQWPNYISSLSISFLPLLPLYIYVYACIYVYIYVTSAIYRVLRQAIWSGGFYGLLLMWEVGNRALCMVHGLLNISQKGVMIIMHEERFITHTTLHILYHHKLRNI